MNKTQQEVLEILGQYLPDQTYRTLSTVASAIVAPKMVTAYDFLDSITDYSVDEKKITAIKDLRDAIRTGVVAGDDSLRWCKETVEEWISDKAIATLRNRLTGDPWANVSRQSQYGYDDESF